MSVGSDGPQDGFAWPPRNAGAADAPLGDGLFGDASPEILGAARRPTIAGTLLRSFERDWVGLETPPLSQRLDRPNEHDDPTGLDQPGDACWRCGGTVGTGEVSGDGCAACASERVPWERAVRLGRYEGELRRAVLETKLTAWRKLGFELGRALGRRLRLAAEKEPAASFAIVPVPVSTAARLRRGTDHTLSLARGVRKELGWPVFCALSQRAGPSQTRFPASQREANVRGRFRVRRSGERGIERWVAAYETTDRVPTLVLLDDVRTTGATLRAVQREVRSSLSDLGKKNLKFWVATVAVADGRNAAPESALAASERGLGVAAMPSAAESTNDSETNGDKNHAPSA